MTTTDWTSWRTRNGVQEEPDMSDVPPPGDDEVEGTSGTAAVETKPRLVTIQAALDDLDRCATLPTIETPFPLLNDALGGGLIGGQMVVLAGGTGAGKSSWVMSVASHHAKAAPVLVASYELPPRLLVARTAAQRLGEKWLNVVRGRVPREDLERVLPPGLAFLSRPPISELETAIKMTADGLGQAPLTILDYLQLITAANLEGESDIRVATAKTSEAIRVLADRTSAPVLLVSAVSRGSNVRLRGARQAAASEFVDVARESSGIEYDSAALLALAVGDDVDDDGRRIGTLAVAKNRFGPHVLLDVRFDGAAGTWTEIGTVESAPEVREDLRDQIRASIRSAGTAPSKNQVIRREGKTLVRGRRTAALAELDAMAEEGEVIIMGGKCHMKDGGS